MFDPYLFPPPDTEYNLRCNGCKRTPTQITAYAWFAEGEGLTNDEYVIQEEGTYNRANGHFWCDECYIAAGQPLGVAP